MILTFGARLASQRVGPAVEWWIHDWLFMSVSRFKTQPIWQTYLYIKSRCIMPLLKWITHDRLLIFSHNNAWNPSEHAMKYLNVGWTENWMCCCCIHIISWYLKINNANRNRISPSSFQNFEYVKYIWIWLYELQNLSLSTPLTYYRNDLFTLFRITLAFKDTN